ncbi:4723_t:CDS:2 [Dentiscutata erythropus]|uniref:4723_t:CDS:1 n=1 Tax=Dentiscutata erythropus TaxID=1348616 RepID=A0A9N9H2W4_9GLOM|nr:4723_t:CDS:2 [Dentiscutata erythropus]
MIDIVLRLQRRINKFVCIMWSKPPSKSRFFRFRIIESRWTRYFIITSILQAILVITLEIRVLLRNDDSSRDAQYFMESTNFTYEDNGCTIKPSLFRMNNIEEENAIFIIFQFFQMWFCFNAVYNQNTIQIIIISIINYLCASFSLVQVFEVKKWYSDLEIACPGGFNNLDPHFCYYDVPLVIVLLLSATIMAFLSWKLYRQFGWNIYRKIGADRKFQFEEAKKDCCIATLPLPSPSSPSSPTSPYKRWPID